MPNRFVSTSSSGRPLTVRMAALGFLCVLLGCVSRPAHASEGNHYHADVIVYGGTSAAVMAAVQVKRMGKSVIMVSPDIHPGGLSSGAEGKQTANTLPHCVRIHPDGAGVNDPRPVGCNGSGIGY